MQASVRMQFAASSRPVIVFIVHAWGGGTIRFATELADLIADRVDVVWAWGVNNKTIHISNHRPYEAQQNFDLANGLAAPVAALKALRPCRVNIIHTIGSQEYITDLVHRLGVPYDVTFTDYHHFSTAPHFEDERGRFIGDEAVARVAKIAGSNIPALVCRAERRIAISQDLAHRIGMFMPGYPVIPVRVAESTAVDSTPVRTVPLADNEMLRVLTLGCLHRRKGLETIDAIARRAESEDFPIEISSLGKSDPQATGKLSKLPCVRLLGGFEQKDLAAIVARLNPHLAWFPFAAPETHSYALSDVMRLGLPVLATAIGAVPERVEGRRSTWVVPFEEADPDHFFQWFKRLHSERLQTLSWCSSIDHLPPIVKSFYPAGYLQPLFGPGSGAGS